MRILASLACFLLLAGCSLTDVDDDLSFRNVSGSGNLHVLEPGTAVFNDAVSWEAFWTAHAIDLDGDGTRLPAPEVDFERETVAAVFLGSRSGCGHFIEMIRGVRVQGDAALVEVRLPSSPSLWTCDMVVFPIHVVAFDKMEEVRFSGDVPGEEG